MDRLHEFMTSTRREVRRSIREASQRPLMADQDIRQGFKTMLISIVLKVWILSIFGAGKLKLEMTSGNNAT